MERYLHYVFEVKNVDISKLKFLDESHFVSRQLTNRKVLGMVNSRVWLKQQTLNTKNGTLTLLTSLVGEPVTFHYTTENNTQFTFIDFVLQCCLDGDLQQRVISQMYFHWLNTS